MKRTICFVFSLLLVLSFTSVSLAMDVKERSDKYPDLRENIVYNVSSFLEEGMAEYYWVSDVDCDFFCLKYDGKEYEATVFTNYNTFLKAENVEDMPMVKGILEASGLTQASTDFTITEAALRANNPEKSNQQIASAAKIICETAADVSECLGKKVNNSALFKMKGTYDLKNGVFSVNELLVEQGNDNYVNATVILPESAQVLHDVGKNEFWDRADYNAAILAKRQELEAQKDEDIEVPEEYVFYYESREAFRKEYESSDTTAAVSDQTRVTFDRLIVRNYANTWTTNPTYCHVCNSSGHYQDPLYYNNAVFSTYYHNNDCCNYLSQALFYGGLNLNNSVWYPYSSAWRYIPSLMTYLSNQGYLVNNGYYWANAGGFINMNGDHVVIIVLNDTVNRQFSAHTNDRKYYAYGNDSSWTYYNLSV